MTPPTESAAVGEIHSTQPRQRGLARRWAAIETGVTGLLLGGALLLVFYTIVLRLIAPGFAPDFTEEITVYAVMWAVLLACGQVTVQREHVSADLVVYLMPAWLQRLAAILGNIAGVGFASFLAVYGARVAFEAWDFGDLSPTSLRFPLWIYYACLPVASVLIAIGHVIAAYDLATNRVASIEPVAPVE